MSAYTKVVLLFAAFLLVLAQACTSSKATSSENLEVVEVEVVEQQVSITFTSINDEANLAEAMPNYGLRRKARTSRSQPIYIYFYNSNAVDGQALVAELKALDYITSASLLQ